MFGIPFIVAPTEAEAQCAYLQTSGLVDGIVTDDSDVFLFGGSKIYRNMFNQSKLIQFYVSDDLHNQTKLKREHYIQLAFLLGSDYTIGMIFLMH